MVNTLDFINKINVDVRKGLGEDCWAYAFGHSVGMLAVFDGCGGSGARKHAYYSGHSEAYLASRLCAGAFFDAFQDGAAAVGDPDKLLNLCGEYCRSSLAEYRPPAVRSSLIRSSMFSTLPTTVAAAFVRPAGNALSVTAAWAGDSRVYLLSPSGLFQLSIDDSEANDPYDTDGSMTNTLSADHAPKINKREQTVPLPAIVLAATDGCFAYYTTPMEFEGVLLSTLLSASCPQEWEDLLTRQLGLVAGDDYTLVMSVLGFRSFERLKQAFTQRYRFLFENYLTVLSGLPESDSATRKQLWNRYRTEYTKYIEG